MERFILFAVLAGSAVGFLAARWTRPQDVVQLELAFAFALRVGGGLVALAALCGIFALWLRGAGPRRLLPGVVVLLAGLAVSGAAWPAVLGLALVGVALVVGVLKMK